MSFWAEPLVHLVAEVGNVHVNDIGIGVKVNVPHVDGNGRTGDHLVFVAQQILQQLKLLGGEGNDPAFAAHLPAVEVHLQLSRP